MIDEPVSALAFALSLGIGCQWLAARLRFPAIVMMLGAGLAVGPGLGWLDPDEVFGSLLTPMIGLSVGILLFEGGLTLRWSAIGSTTRTVIWRLLTVAPVITFILASVFTDLLTPLPTGVAILFGALMVVTGPTVVIPLVNFARLRPRVGRILRWEGIIVDPIGAVLGVCVLEVLLLEDGTFGEAIVALVRISAAGCAVGGAIAGALVVALDRHWVPDHLRAVLALVAAIAAFAIGNEVAHDAGLYATTVAGIVLANQRKVRVAPILELHEHLASLILAATFVLLAAKVDAQTLSDNLAPAAAITAALILVVRPASVLLGTIGTSLTRPERLYLAGLAPRGIVAASVSAVFAASLVEGGVDGGEDLAAITFLVVCGTVVVYGLGARPLARALHVGVPEPTGVVLVGAGRWARALGNTLADIGTPVLLIAEDETRADGARRDGLLVYAGSLEGEELPETLEAMGSRLAIMGSDAGALDAATVDKVVAKLGRASVYRIARDDDHAAEVEAGEAVEGRHAFAPLTQAALDELFDEGAEIKALPVGSKASHRDRPVLRISTQGIPSIVTAEDAKPALGEQLVVVRLPG